jgi:hypothetical protein
MAEAPPPEGEAVVQLRQILEDALQRVKDHTFDLETSVETIFAMWSIANNVAGCEPAATEAAKFVMTWVETHAARFEELVVDKEVGQLY